MEVSVNEGKAFQTNGYAVIRSFFDPAQLDTVGLAVGEVLSAPSDPSMNRIGNELYQLRWNHPIIATALQAIASMNALRNATDACNLGWISGYVSTKRGRSPALGWHQDWWSWDHPASFQRQATQIAVLCYLSDTTKKNGALRVLPGSHHFDTATHRVLPEAHGESARMLPVDHPALNSVPGETTLGLRAGDAAVLDYRLLHGTHPNKLFTRRDAVLLSFVLDWAGLPPDLRSHYALHPALPGADENKLRLASSYVGLLPDFDGGGHSLCLNRIPPIGFCAADR